MTIITSRYYSTASCRAMARAKTLDTMMMIFAVSFSSRAAAGHEEVGRAPPGDFLYARDGLPQADEAG